MFVNWFGLGTIGGDVARGLVLGSRSKQKATALASVFADRVHGLTVLASICLVSMAAFGRHPIGGEYIVFMVFCIIAVVLVWYFGPAIALMALPHESVLYDKIQQIARVFPRKILVIGYVSAVSLLFHLLQIATHQMMAYGFGIHIPWKTLLIAVPVINILATLPISWNGLGVRENAYIFFLSPLFLSREQAIGFGAIWLLGMTASSGYWRTSIVFISRYASADQNGADAHFLKVSFTDR
jgi:hypothetical protein